MEHSVLKLQARAELPFMENSVPQPAQISMAMDDLISPLVKMAVPRSFFETRSEGRPFALSWPGRAEILTPLAPSYDSVMEVRRVLLFRSPLEVAIGLRIPARSCRHFLNPRPR